MIAPTNANDVSDARLVAYIDGELNSDERAFVARALEQSPELRERLAFLGAGGRPFGEAFDLLLEAAPQDRLQAMFSGLIEDERMAVAPVAAAENVLPPRATTRRGWSPVWQVAAAASLALAIFGGGIATGMFYGGKPAEQLPPGQRNWVDAVAQYVSLFSGETLAGMPTDAAAREAGLQRASSALGIQLTHEKLAGLPTLDFKGTQLLQLQGRPIAQIAFMSQTGKPVAICIIRTTRAPEPPAPDHREGLNIVHWIKDGYGYMVIGDVPPDALARISEAARARLS